VVREAFTPLWSKSVRSRLRLTWGLAALAVLLLAAAIASDPLARSFWQRHPLLTNLVASLVAVILTVAVINEVLERRQRRRWSVLAQYVLMELVRTARVTWTTLMELSGLMFADDQADAALDAGADTLRDTPRAVGAMCELLADPERRERLHRAVERLMSGSDEVLGRWAPVMLNAAPYAEVIDRHVELYSRLAWVGSLLDHFEPTDEDPRRRRLSRSSPAVQLQGEFDDQWLSDSLITIAQLAERLDRGTLELALQIVPLEWWQTRAGHAPARSGAQSAAPSARHPVA